MAITLPSGGREIVPAGVCGGTPNPTDAVARHTGGDLHLWVQCALIQQERHGVSRAGTLQDLLVGPPCPTNTPIWLHQGALARIGELDASAAVVANFHLATEQDDEGGPIRPNIAVKQGAAHANRRSGSTYGIGLATRFAAGKPERTFYSVEDDLVGTASAGIDELIKIQRRIGPNSQSGLILEHKLSGALGLGADLFAAVDRFAHGQADGFCLADPAGNLIDDLLCTANALSRI